MPAIHSGLYPLKSLALNGTARAGSFVLVVTVVPAPRHPKSAAEAKTTKRRRRLLDSAIGAPWSLPVEVPTPRPGPGPAPGARARIVCCETTKPRASHQGQLRANACRVSKDVSGAVKLHRIGEIQCLGTDARNLLDVSTSLTGRNRGRRYIAHAWDLRPLRSRAAVHSLVSKLTHIYGNAV